MNLIPENTELTKKLVDLQKRFLKYRMYPKYLAAPHLVAAKSTKASTSLQMEDVSGTTQVDW